ncbi:MAG: GntR family transcriptional regulator [Anaerovoracaceae bacterium]|nr:GntR family transcriptional regulator [Anaerovoracaceae bacterium]
MDIILSNSSGKPIYDQISSQIREKIISGQLSAGDALPSMRLLAKELKISVITTKRAYEELERDGFIVTMTGKGSFVAGKNTEVVREEYLRRIEENFREILSMAKGCGLSLQELEEILETLHESEEL